VLPSCKSGIPVISATQTLQIQVLRALLAKHLKRNASIPLLLSAVQAGLAYGGSIF
jgi:hypothetical protein